jgi:hypothetical protein
MKKKFVLPKSGRLITKISIEMLQHFHLSFVTSVFIRIQCVQSYIILNNYSEIIISFKRR